MEALACNKPVLSSMLGGLDFGYSELGLFIDNVNDIFSKSEAMIESFRNNSNCRESAIGHLDGNTMIIDKLCRIYTEK
jgi:hypothetical protein